MFEDHLQTSGRDDEPRPARSWTSAAWLKAFRRVSTDVARPTFEFSFRPADEDDLPQIETSPSRAPEADVIPSFAADPTASAVEPPAGHRMLAILNAMLAIQDEPDDDAGDLPALEIIDLAAAVQGACDAFTVSGRPRWVRVASDVDLDALGAGRGDPLRLRQLLLTLLADALRGRDDADLVLAPERSAYGLRLELRGADGGRLARRFARTRSLVQGLGGDLSVAQAPHGGAVILELPLDAVDGPQRTARPVASPQLVFEAEPVVQFSRPDLGLRVLVAEADPSTQSAIAVLLADMGVEALRADDPDQALAIWREEACDAVLLDLDSHEMMGAALARAIRSAEAVTRWPRTPLIGFTARQGPRQAEAHLSLDLDLHLLRPVSGSALRETLGQALQLEISPPAQSIAIG